jgi:hypothetical protein
MSDWDNRHTQSLTIEALKEAREQMKELKQSPTPPIIIPLWLYELGEQVGLIKDGKLTLDPLRRGGNMEIEELRGRFDWCGEEAKCGHCGATGQILHYAPNSYACNACGATGLSSIANEEILLFKTITT